MDSIVNSYHAHDHAMAAGLGMDAYFEYVRSKANVADFPLRFERLKLREALVDGGLGHLYVEWVWSVYCPHLRSGRRRRRVHGCSVGRRQVAAGW